MGHYGVANSRALEIAGITRATADPPGGTINRDAEGNPTGVLKESAQRLVSRLIPASSPEQVRNGMRQLAAAFNEEGMTGLKDPGIGAGVWSAYQDVLAAGALSVRVFALWQGGGDLHDAAELVERIGPFNKSYLSTGDDHLISGGIKLYIDGSGGARTAWLHDPWSVGFDALDDGNFGYPVVEPQLLRDKIRMFHNAGIHVSVHSIGDRAIDWSSVAREPLLGVYNAKADGSPFGSDESVDIHTALCSFTIWSARQIFLEDKIGSIEIGKYADIAIWDRDLYSVPTADLENLDCQMTIFNGRIVYQDPETALVVSEIAS